MDCAMSGCSSGVRVEGGSVWGVSLTLIARLEVGLVGHDDGEAAVHSSEWWHLRLHVASHGRHEVVQTKAEQTTLNTAQETTAQETRGAWRRTVR